MPTAPDALHLLALYGYPGLFAVVFVAAVGVGAPIPVTALLLTLGALTGARGAPSFALLALAGVAGAAGGHCVDYWAGRAGNRLVQGWLARLERRAGTDGVFAALLRLRGGRALLLFLSRFVVTAVASPVSVLAGATRMAFGLYLAIETAGEALYVLGNLTIGRLLGARLLSGGGFLPAFWVALAALVLLPLALGRAIAWALGRVRGNGADVVAAAPGE